MMYLPFRHMGSVFWKRHPVQLTFFVTRKCNSRCPFCFYLESKKGSEDSEPELSLDEIEKISKSMRNMLWILFSGGEVYLRDDITEISRMFYENNKPAILTYPTNGLLPQLIKEKTEEILKQCSRSVVVVKISIDGLYADHDSLRGVAGNFEKAMQTCEMLGLLLDKYPNLELGINTVFCSKNQDKMQEIINFVNRMDKIKTHTISMIRGELEDKSYKEINLAFYRDAIETMEENLMHSRASMYRFRGAKLKAAQDILQRRLIYETMLQERRVLPCYAGRLNIVLTERGDVYPCELLEKKMGNVRDYNYDMRRLLQSAESKMVIDKIDKNNCYCSHECYFTTNILFNPRMYGRLLKEYVRLWFNSKIRIHRACKREQATNE